MFLKRITLRRSAVLPGIGVKKDVEASPSCPIEVVGSWVRIGKALVFGDNIDQAELDIEATRTASTIKK